MSRLWLSAASKLRGPVPVYPALLVCAFIVQKLIESWGPLPAATRPVVVLGTAVLVIQLAATAVAGRHRAAYAASLLVLGAFDLAVAAALFGLAVIPLVWLSIRRGSIVALDWRRLTSALNAIALIAFVLVLGTAAAVGVRVPSRSPVVLADGPGQVPDIYLILLDAYPRSDTLRDQFSFDNAPFLERMRTLGFSIAAAGQSNYNQTALTVTSVLNGRHMNDLAPSPPATLPAQLRLITALINDGAAVTEARRLGYRIVSIPTQISYLSILAADQVIDRGRLTQFEYFLPNNGWLSSVLPTEQREFYRDHHRGRVLDAFSGLAHLAEAEAGQPRLVVAHILVPHPPIAFGADGKPAVVRECFWEECTLNPMSEELRIGIVNQLAFTNDAVYRTVSQIVAKSPRPPVIVVFSDHGYRHDPEDLDEMFRTLFMSYTPGIPDLFPDDATPINILPRILNAYAAADLSLATEDRWVSRNETGDLLPVVRYGD